MCISPVVVVCLFFLGVACASEWSITLYIWCVCAVYKKIFIVFSSCKNAQPKEPHSQHRRDSAKIHCYGTRTHIFYLAHFLFGSFRNERKSVEGNYARVKKHFCLSIPTTDFNRHGLAIFREHRTIYYDHMSILKYSDIEIMSEVVVFAM